MILWFTSLTFASTMCILTAPSNHNCHLPPSPHPTPTSSLIHQWRGGAAIWRWEMHFINIFSLMYWLTCIFFGTPTMFRGTVHNITHTNHKPQPATWPSNIHYWQGDAAMARWDIIFNTMFLYYIHPHLLFVLTCTSIVTYATINSPNNTTPCDNHPFGLKTKGSANKKGEKWYTAEAVLIQSTGSLTSLSALQLSQASKNNAKTPKHITIRHLMSQKRMAKCEMGWNR